MRLIGMTPHRVPLLAWLVVLLAAGCTAGDRDGAAAPTPPTGAAPTMPSTPVATAPPAAPATSDGTGTTTRAGATYRVAYGWAVPSRPARVAHAVRVPVVPPPGPPLPTLTQVGVGDHPAEGYSRITFAFRGATPSYELAYVPRVEAEGSGDPLPLTGNAFLRIRFDQAQAHDEGGRPTITGSPRPEVGYPTLRSYRFGGDFEGYLTFGLGIQVAGGSDQVLPIRAGELTRPDGSYVVAVDVRRG